MTGRAAQMRHRVATSVIVLTSARFASRALDFVTLVVLARQLTPADFGLVAIAMSVVQITEAILELPTGNALLQLKAIGRSHLHTAFTIAALRGAVLAAILCALSVPLAAFFGDPRLVPLICALSIAPAARALRSPKSALAFKHLRFRPDALAELFGKACALGIAIGLALATGSYWAIAAGSIASALFYVAGTFVLMPLRPVLTLRDWRLFHRYLGWMMASQTASALNWQADRFLLGKFASQSTVGHFATLRDLSAITQKVLFESIQRPLIAALSRSSGEPQRQAAAYRLSIGSLLSIGVPVAVGQALLAPEIVRLVLGPQWLTGVIVFQAASLALILNIYASTTATLLYATGNPAQIFRRNLIDLAFRLPATVIGILAFGWLGAVWAFLAADCLLAALCIVLAKREIGIGIGAQLARAVRPGLSALAMALAVLAMRQVLPAPHAVVPLIGFLAATIVTGGAVYCLVHWCLWRLGGRPDGIETLMQQGAARMRHGVTARLATLDAKAAL